VIVTNIVVPAAGMFTAVSLDGGSTWATRIIGNNDNLGAACCDPTLSFDEFGNLFLTYLFNVGHTVPVALSTDGGSSFNIIANIAKPATSKFVNREAQPSRNLCCAGIFKAQSSEKKMRFALRPLYWETLPAVRAQNPHIVAAQRVFTYSPEDCAAAFLGCEFSTAC
jgi:hypothetical protein